MPAVKMSSVKTIFMKTKIFNNLELNYALSVFAINLFNAIYPPIILIRPVHKITKTRSHTKLCNIKIIMTYMLTCISLSYTTISTL